MTSAFGGRQGCEKGGRSYLCMVRIGGVREGGSIVGGIERGGDPYRGQKEDPGQRSGLVGKGGEIILVIRLSRVRGLIVGQNVGRS